MKISRREFIRTSGVAAALGLGVPGLVRARSTVQGVRLDAAGSPLRIPPLFTGETLVAEVTEQEIWPGEMSEVWTLGGSWPAPTIRVRRGDTFSVQLINRLDEPTIVHWHGLIVPHVMDGHPTSVIAPNATFDYSFTVDQRAGAYWYHPHPHHRTGPQVYMGMAGLFIVEDDEEEALGLPSGDYEIPLVIQDRRTSDAHQFTYELAGASFEIGYLGDTLFVNGTLDPYLDAEAGLYRFRLLNGSNARILYVGFDDGRTFRLIGTDGGLLDRPYDMTGLSLAPAERADILVDFSNDPIGSTIVMKSIRTAGGGGYPPPQGAEMPILTINVAREATKTFTVPEKLATIEPLDPSASVRGRTFEMQSIHGASEDGHQINGLTYDMQRIDQQVYLGDLEIWTFWNRSAEPHPIHVHCLQFQVLERGGSTDLPPSDRGWKDTVLTLPYETVRVLVRFNRYPGVYLVHCHNLEHEDHGMMSNFEVLERTTGVEGYGDLLPGVLNLH